MTALLWLRANWRLAVMLALAAGIAVQSIRLESAKADLATEKAASAQRETQWYAAWAKAVDENADREVAHAAATMENADALTKANQARAVAERANDPLSISLRDAIQSAAGVRVSAPATDAAACQRARDNAAALGDLLQDALGSGRTLAAAAEKHADGVRFWMRQDQIDRAACGSQ